MLTNAMALIAVSWHTFFFLTNLLKMLLYNPCSLHNERLEEIILNTTSYDVIAMPGTQRRQIDPHVVVTRAKVERHMVLSWGWK